MLIGLLPKERSKPELVTTHGDGTVILYVLSDSAFAWDGLYMRQYLTAIVIMSVFAAVDPAGLGGARGAFADEALSPLERAIIQRNQRERAASIREGGSRTARPQMRKTPEQPRQSPKSARTGAAGFQPAQWAEGSSRASGATREYFDRAASLKWRKRLGDWYDAGGVLYGNRPFSVAPVKDLDREQTISWDVTTLVRGWLTGKYQNTGLFLKISAKKGGGTIVFYSREYREKSRSPVLRVSFAGTPEYVLKPTADTFLEPSTVKSQGKGEFLKVASGRSTLIRFDSGALRDLGPFVKAALVLHTTARQYGPAIIGIYRPAPELAVAPKAATGGIADRYSKDRGIKADKDVIFAEKFESKRWLESWSGLSESSTANLVVKDAGRMFVPLSGKALKVVIRQGKNTGLNLRYKFARQTGKEPEAAYFRYYLRLSPDWRPTVQGGKLPGFAGTYNNAGWGGRRSNGENGWSTRGKFLLAVPKGSPLRGRIPIGTYAYHADMEGYYGDAWMWTNGGLGTLETNRWYCIEQYVRLNRVGHKDGVFKAWIDGRLAYVRKNIRYRTSSKLKIEEVWMNVYHGGTKPAPQDYTLYIDNVVIARSYIGPIKQ